MLRLKTPETTSPAAIATSKPLFGRRNVPEAKTQEAVTDTEASTTAERTAAQAAASERAASALAARDRQRRRAVRRRRAAAVTLVGASLFTWRWIDANKVPTISLLPANSLAPETMNGPNAGHFYAAAADVLHISGEHTDPSVATLAEERDNVAMNGQALALLRKGFQYQYQGDHTRWMKSETPPSLSRPIQNLVSQRELARLLADDACVKAAQGDVAGAMSASLDAVRFGRDIGHDDTAVVGGMVGSLCEGIGTWEAQRHVDGLSAVDARAALARLNDPKTEEIRLPDIVKSWERTQLGTYQDLFLGNTQPAALLGSPTMNPLIQFRYDADLLRYGKQGLVRNLMSMMDGAILHASLPYQQAKNGVYLPPGKDLFTAKMQGENLPRAHQVLTAHAAQARILLARLAVQAFRQEHGGALPTSLAELTIGPRPYLHAVPFDPFSLSGADPLRYENGKVYSVGENGQDDHGAGDDDWTKL